MTRLCNGQGEDFPEAAKRHYNDARQLESGGRWDSVAYHYGFVIECSLKTAILLGSRSPILDKKFKNHDLSTLSTEVIRLASRAFGPRSITISSVPTAYALLDAQSGSGGKWIDMRYRPEGALAENAAKAIGAVARDVFVKTIVQFYAAGELP